MALGADVIGMVQHPTERAFLHDICSNPADDSVRLIYADWLDDRGLPGNSERAEFIRGQIEIARLCQEPAAPWTDFQLMERYECLRNAVDNGEYEFLVPDWTETPDGWWSWYADGPQIVVTCGSSPSHYLFTLHWRRGFIEAISLSLVDFQAHAARLFASHPVQHVTLTDREPARLPVARGEADPGLWGWVNHPGIVLPGPQQFYRLPGCLYDALEGWVYNQRAWRFYRTPEEAQDALSQACVRWGRHQAGLLEGMAEVTAE